MITADPMRFHGPGWTVAIPNREDPAYRLYQLWAPRPATPATDRESAHAERVGWSAHWHRDDSDNGSEFRGASPSPEHALACIPDDPEGRIATRALLSAARTWQGE